MTLLAPETVADYTAFLTAKRITPQVAGFDVDPSILNVALKDWQKAIVRWALRLGRAALFEDCGLGKSFQQLEWARIVADHTGMPVLILAPLAVSRQTADEGAKFGISVTVCASQADVQPGVNVTNYEKLKHFDASAFGGVVLDESSILKSFTGATKRQLMTAFQDTPYKLCCTATPAPNDYLELGNHAEFLGVMRANEMLMRWFINNTMKAGDYRLKGHAVADYWQWVASWAVSASKPSDVGEYSDDGYVLPQLDVTSHVLDTDLQRAWDGGRLFYSGSVSATEMWAEKRATAGERAAFASALVQAEPNHPWIVWCDTNDEADRLVELLPEAIEVRGNETPEAKERKLIAFTRGQARIIITKSDIAGLGLNWQHCARQVFTSVNYSFEKFYQSLRRSYRFGQQQPVIVHMVASETETDILSTLKRKEEGHRAMQVQMNLAMRQHGLAINDRHALQPAGNEIAQGDRWKLYLGDCVEQTKRIDDQSVDFSVFSPPFANLYIYSDSEADMGNCKDGDEFFQHFGYLIPELLRVTRPGRLCAVHCKDLPLYMNRDGSAGLEDFPGAIVDAFCGDGTAELMKAREVLQKLGLDTSAVDAALQRLQQARGPAFWQFHSRVTIWKDPVTEMQRTKTHGLLHKNFTERGEVVRQGMPDYVLVFRKWDAEMPDKQVSHHLVAPTPDQIHTEVIAVDPETAWDFGHEPGTTSYTRTTKTALIHPNYIGTDPPAYWRNDRDYSIQVWQRYASPVWFDINQQRVLNAQVAREDADEKHICPLQLDVIARCVDLWTNPGETVFSPFAGIGSEGYESLKLNRKFIGVELKRAYWEIAQRNLRSVEQEVMAPTLFDMEEVA
jgi:DNA modification methylase